MFHVEHFEIGVKVAASNQLDLNLEKAGKPRKGDAPNPAQLGSEIPRLLGGIRAEIPPKGEFPSRRKGPLQSVVYSIYYTT